MKKSTVKPRNLSNDLLKGADEIAAFLGIPKGRVYVMAEKGSELPLFKMRGLIYARRSSLLERIEYLENRVYKHEPPS